MLPGFLCIYLIVNDKLVSKISTMLSPYVGIFVKSTKTSYIFHFQHERSINRNLPFEALLDRNHVSFKKGHCGEYLAPIQGQPGLRDIPHAPKGPLYATAVHAHDALVRFIRQILKWKQ